MRGLWRLKNVLAQARARQALRQAERAVAHFPRVRPGRPHGLAQPLIVSLTSFPARYPTLAKTLKSLLDQNVMADRTILWLGHGDADRLPADVLALKEYGLEIRSCEDMRSFTKLIPALQAFPEASIVTADDDIYYRPDWLAGLVAMSLAHPSAVVAHRCHLAFRKADGSFRPYGEWQMETTEQVDTKDGVLFPTGVGGVLYPQGALNPLVMDVAVFRELCPRADDVWFFWMARLAGTAQRGDGSRSTPLSWEGSQDVGLFHQNALNGENNSQIAAIERRLGYLPVSSTLKSSLPRNNVLRTIGRRGGL